ncbi:MAG: hypothetical protein ACLPN5_16925 [Roseiarcus sp.]
MRYVMRQSRDGETEIIDVGPHPAEPGLFEMLRKPRWSAALTWFMRTMCWVWLAKGLFHWAVLLGVTRSFGDFEMLPQALKSSMVVFAAADLVAAVGLWLAAPWGGALWLVCAATESLTPLMGSRGSFVNSFTAALNLTLILAYFLLRWIASRERY